MKNLEKQAGERVVIGVMSS